MGLAVGLIGIASFAGWSLFAVLFYVVLAGGPFLVYIALIRTAIGTILMGLALIGTALAVQAYVSARWKVSSTAPIGYYHLPLYGVPVVILGRAIEAVLTIILRRRHRSKADSTRPFRTDG